MAVSLVAKMRDVPLAFVDVETTGASPENGDRVIEVGVVRVEGGEVVGTLQKLVDPRRPISAGITALTGISPEMCAGQPVWGDVMDEVTQMMRGAVVVGHNVPFDLGFLRNEYRKSGASLVELLPGAMVLDTVRIARKRFGSGGNGLQKLAARFGCADTTAHRALADAQTTFKVFCELVGPLGGKEIVGGLFEVGGWKDAMLADVIIGQGGPMKLEGVQKKGALPYEVEEALERGGPVEMEYVDVKEERSVRVVTPIEVRKFRGEMILLAWCAMRQERRTFKLSRIVRLTKVDGDSQVGGEGEGTEGRGQAAGRKAGLGAEGTTRIGELNLPGVIRGSELGKGDGV